MNMRTWTVFSWLGFALACASCDKGPPVPVHDHADHADHAMHEHPTAQEAEKPAGPKIETDSFLLAMAPTQPTYTVGRAGELEIALQSRGEWHVNEDYPIRVDLKGGSGIKIGERELVKDDAKEFGAEKVRFVTSVEPTATGDHEVTCDVSFAMCTEENCILEKRTVAMVLEVQ
jgi:hypothetical protein